MAGKKNVLNLNLSFKDFKTKEPVKIISFEMCLARIMDKALARLTPEQFPKDDSPEEKEKLNRATLPLIVFQSIIQDCRVEGVVDATLKEIFYLSLTKLTERELGTGYKILSRLNAESIDLSLVEAKVLLNGVTRLRANSRPDDEINVFAKMFGVGSLQDYILTLNPNEKFDIEPEEVAKK
jgi:hypothetical protein